MWPSPTARSDMMIRHGLPVEAALVGMGHDAGVHQRRGGVAIFVAEIGADQLLAFVADALRATSLSDRANLLEALEEDLAGLPVALLEIAASPRSWRPISRSSSVSTSSTSRRARPGSAGRLATPVERPNDDPRRIRLQPQRMELGFRIMGLQEAAKDLAFASVPALLSSQFGLAKALPHGQRGKMQRQDRFRTLVAVDAGRHQSVEAAAVARIGQGTPASLSPKNQPNASRATRRHSRVAARGISRRSSVDRRRGFERLLVERQRRCVGPAEAVAPDRAEGAARAGLLPHQPAQGREAGRSLPAHRAPCRPGSVPPAGAHCHRQAGLEPVPFVARIAA